MCSGPGRRVASVFFREVFQRVLTVEGAIAGLVFVVVLLVLLVAVLRRRAGADRPPSPRAKRTGLEVTYVVLLAAIAGFLVWFTASANAQDTASTHPRSTKPPAAAVQVTAFQWCWRFHYVQQPVTVTGTCQPNQYPTMVVPTGGSIQIQLTSQDVVHAFWVPDLDVKVDAYPDHTNTFTLSFDKPGRWLGRCAEFCGTYHTTMDFYIRAVSPAQYKQWLAQHGGAA
jgi:cytochrome c oxidase subunit 2